ncbi:MAG: 16S rRNA (adenine(1518)-N(6)/adenine(1519)-N(6))-dimethyltransferase RsmA [Terriglobales bacterium]
MAEGNMVNGTADAGKQKAKAPVPKKNSGKRPKLGQNFLIDRTYAEKIIAALGDISQKRVIEIGAGQGVLTDLLIRRAGRVISIELDRVLSAQLRMRYATQTNVEVLEGDILKIDFAHVLGPRPGALAGVTPRAPEPVSVVGNIPYYITSDILLRLFQFHRFFDTIVLMVQKEVADRIAAAPGSRDYGLLSATAQVYARVENVLTVPPGAFNPPPKVYSSVLRLTVAPRLEKLGVAEREFIDFLKLSFGQKRKTLVNNLKSEYDTKAIQAALKKAGVRADARAETLPLEKAAAVYKLLVAGS